MKKPKFYRTRQRVIRAMRVDYDLINEPGLKSLLKFIGKHASASKTSNGLTIHEQFDISFKVSMGDYVLRNEKGQLSGCDANLFKDTYEPV